jgi:hypothetical protein
MVIASLSEKSTEVLYTKKFHERPPCPDLRVCFVDWQGNPTKTVDSSRTSAGYSEARFRLYSSLKQSVPHVLLLFPSPFSILPRGIYCLLNSLTVFNESTWVFIYSHNKLNADQGRHSTDCEALLLCLHFCLSSS